MKIEKNNDSKEKSVYAIANEDKKLFLELRELKKHNNITEYTKLREKLIVKNIGLAIKIANQDSIRKIENISQDDKEQMAMIGLIDAIDRFDPNEGNFAKYAIKTIYITIISENIKNNCRVYKKENIIDRINLMKNEYYMTFGRNPSREEILNLTGLSKENLMDLEILNNLNNVVSYDEYKDNNIFLNVNTDNYQEISDNPVIDGVYNDEMELEQNQSKGDIIEKGLVESQLRELLNKNLEELNPREKLILELRFGLNGKEKMKFSEMARILKTTENVVKSIFYRTLEKLREGDKDLEDFYYER